MPVLIVGQGLKPLIVSVGHRAVIGQGSEVDLSLDNPRISQHHAEVFHRDGSWVVSDLNSVHGTFRGGERITEIVLTEPVTQISFGGDPGITLHFTKAEEVDRNPLRVMKCGDPLGPSLVDGCFLEPQDTSLEWHTTDVDYEITEINRMHALGFITSEVKDEALALRGLGSSPQECFRSNWEPLRFVFHYLSAPGWIYRPVEELDSSEVRGKDRPTRRRGLTPTATPQETAGALKRIPKNAWGRIQALGLAVAELIRRPMGVSPLPARAESNLRRAMARSYDPDCRPDLSGYFHALSTVLSRVTLPAALLHDLQRAGLGSQPEMSPQQIQHHLDHLPEWSSDNVDLRDRHLFDEHN